MTEHITRLNQTKAWNGEAFKRAFARTFRNNLRAPHMPQIKSCSPAQRSLSLNCFSDRPTIWATDPYRPAMRLLPFSSSEKLHTPPFCTKGQLFWGGRGVLCVCVCARVFEAPPRPWQEFCPPHSFIMEFHCHTLCAPGEVLQITNCKSRPGPQGFPQKG